MKPKSINQDELEFVSAIAQYKKKHDKLFLSWKEVLSVVKALKYVKVDLHSSRH